MNKLHPQDYTDISATEFKKQFGKTLDAAVRGQAVRIIRHGRREESLVLVREDELAALRAQVSSPLDALREEFDALVARMQTPEAKRAAASLGSASPEELGKAALQAHKTDTPSRD